MTDYPKRLIEVDLPIKRISAHARREKSIRHGHISTLHIWWARRPLAACRAVICAALWPDPADPICPQGFRDAAARLIAEFAGKVYHTAALHATASRESFGQWEGIVKAQEQGLAIDTHDPAHLNKLRFALLDFIADFANWDNSTVPAYLETARSLTAAAHEALGGEPGTRPLVVDPFAGGGSIPLEALRVGADAFASDLNPVAVLLNKVVLEYIPKYGQRLADEVRKWGAWIKEQAEKELAEFYPKDPDGATPIAYLWARTIKCEGPGCGAEVPLMRSFWLARKGSRSIAIKLVPNREDKRVEVEIVQEARPGDVGGGTVKRGSATCPCCGYTTPVARVRDQLKARRGGSADARMFGLVTGRDSEQGRFYRLPSEHDVAVAQRATKELARREEFHKGELSLVPDEKLDLKGIRHTWAMLYGLESWGSYFTPRQVLGLSTLAHLVRSAAARFSDQEAGFVRAVQSCLALAVNRQADRASSICRWDAPYQKISNTFGRQALPISWDFAESNIFSGATGDFEGAVAWVREVIEANMILPEEGIVSQNTATCCPLPADIAAAMITDPPYYDAVPYAYLADFFHVWLRRSLANAHPHLLNQPAVPKDEEIVVDRTHTLSNSTHDVAFYERELTKAFAEGRRIVQPQGVATIVFASKTTASWEAILKAVIDAGWVITGSWPIDTEMENRVSAQGQARLASSVHLVCRPRENPDGSLCTEDIGEWRDVLQELPGRIHEWLPRLAEEGIVGADAIFACLGPALEIFSRYSRVERADGTPVTLREYLAEVWAAVSKEALSLLFKDADTSALEPDARLTAMWLWTLRTDRSEANGNGSAGDETQDDADDDAEDEDAPAPSSKGGGYILEFDAARKIAQGLGANLDTLKSVVEVKGQTARLRSVSEREAFLFARQKSAMPAGRPIQTTETALAPKRGKSKRPARGQQAFAVDDEGRLSAQAASGRADRLDVVPEPETSTDWTTAETVLDRVHQAMLLFAKGRSDALKRFLVDDGIGKEARFWKLAQSLSALYPPGTDEKRWVDGVLARKKGLGL
jgi:putative DNA methylase